MASLCETCDREVFFKCRWVMDGYPVANWNAQFIKSRKRGQLDTFMVISCPNYLKEKRKLCSNKCYKAAASKAAADKKKIKTAEDLKKLIKEAGR